MKKFLCSLILFAGVILLTTPFVEARIAPLRVVFISGSGEYESDKTMPILKKYLESKYPSLVTMVSAKGDDLPGLEALEKCETAVLFTRRLKVQGDQLERIKKYCTSGKPLVGIRTASHAIQTFLELDKEVFGGNYKGHYKDGPLTEVELPQTSRSHRILNGVTSFKSKGSLYKNTGLAEDVAVLLHGSADGKKEPIAWTRDFKKGRIFYTSLGHQKDFEEESFLRLMTNAILWSAQRTLLTK
ncbi:MAG: hypothetical protein EXS16_21995 [Gemmataceae bacterium]|nr:hypothetical protein [Gemmataceae bacterium]